VIRRISIIGSIAIVIVSLLVWGLGPVLAQDNDYRPVEKPFGIEARDDVEKIPVNSTIHHFSDGTTEVYGPDNTRVLRTRDSKVGLMPVPIVGPSKASHVYQVPSGSSVGRNGNEIKIYFHGDCILTVINEQLDKKADLRALLGEEQSLPLPPGISSKWVEYSRDWDVDDLAYFYAEWDVPNAPPDDDDYWINNYIFNGIVDPEYEVIIQPVLEWNVPFGTYDWTAAAWWVAEEDWVRADPIDCAENDDLYGYMRLIDEEDEEWKIKIRNTDEGENSILYTEPGNFPACNNLKIYCALEAYYFRYHVSDDDQVCGDIHFEDMEVEDEEYDTININWSEHTPGDAWGLTGLYVDDVSDEEVILYTAN